MWGTSAGPLESQTKCGSSKSWDSVLVPAALWAGQQKRSAFHPNCPCLRLWPYSFFLGLSASSVSKLTGLSSTLPPICLRKNSLQCAKPLTFGSTNLSNVILSFPIPLTHGLSGPRTCSAHFFRASSPCMSFPMPFLLPGMPFPGPIPSVPDARLFILCLSSVTIPYHVVNVCLTLLFPLRFMGFLGTIWSS